MKTLQTTNYDVIDPQYVKDEIIEKYLMLKEGRTKDDYRSTLRVFFKFLDENDHDVIGPFTVASYKINMQSKGLKPASINKYLCVLSDFFGWCFELGYLPYNAFRGVKMVKVSKQDRARALTKDEVNRLFNCLGNNDKDNQLRVMMMCLFYLGLRAHEVANIKLSDIDFERKTIEILGKGKKLRVLGLNDALLRVILGHISHYKLEPTHYLVGSYRSLHKASVSVQHVNRSIKEVSRRAGLDLESIKSHSGRVTAINFLLDNDISLRDAANFAGHSDIATTRRYDRKSTDKIIDTCKVIKF